MEIYEDSKINRRGFLKATVVTAVAAAATGAGAALLKSQNQAATITPALTVPLSAPSQHAASAAVLDPTVPLQAQLAALRAENAQLQAALSIAESQLTSQTAVNDGTTTVNEALHVELDNANTRLGVMAGLVGLYEQLDEADIGAMVEEGLTAVSSRFEALTAEIPSANEGIMAGRVALDEFEAHIPLLENGRAWLDSQQQKMSLYFDGVERALQAAADSIGPVLQMFNEWLQKVLKWLPFGLGEKSSSIATAVADLLTETPLTIGGLDANIAQPLDVWLGAANEEAPLRHRLIKPMREGALDKAESAIAQAEGVKAVYEAELKQKVATAVGSQRAIRSMIVQYREMNQV